MLHIQKMSACVCVCLHVCVCVCACVRACVCTVVFESIFALEPTKRLTTSTCPFCEAM
jgi:hypothetical protein